MANPNRYITHEEATLSVKARRLIAAHDKEVFRHWNDTTALRPSPKTA